MRIIFLALLVSACSHQIADNRDITGINPEFNAYVQEFETLYGGSIGDVPIQFADLADNITGECYTYNGVYKEIKIDQAYWNNFGYEARHNVIFHELGHCVLNRDHDSTIMPNGYPDSFMYPYIFFNNSIAYLQAHYDTELFNLSGVPMLSSLVQQHSTQRIRRHCQADE